MTHRRRRREPCRSTSTTSRAWCASATATTPRPCFLLLRVKDAAAARAWLRRCPVASAVDAEPPPDVLQIAFTSDGLRALGVRDDIVDGFSAGIRRRHGRRRSRARRLGDVGENDPSHWQWGGGRRACRTSWCMLYALPGQLAALAAGGRGRSARPASSGWRCLTHIGHATASSPSASPTASRSPSSTGSASSAARRSRAPGLHEPQLPWRIPARLSERIRPLHRRGRCSTRSSDAEQMLPRPRTRRT